MNEMNIKLTILSLITVMLFVSAYIFSLSIKEPDIMSESNLCRPVPENFRICGMEYDHVSNAVFIRLANGDKLLTDCKADEYPKRFNSTHFSCADQVWKTVKDLQP